MTPATWLNIVLLIGALVIAFIYLRKDAIKEKAKEKWVKDFSKYSKTDEFKARRSYAAQYLEINDPSELLPQIERDDFEFIDLAAEAIDTPPEFRLPTLSQKRSIEPNDQVLLRMVFDDGEHESDVWLQVDTKLANDLFSGKIIAVADTYGAKFIDKQTICAANHIGFIERPINRPEAN